MKRATFATLAAVVAPLFLAGCANTERSRDLGNPDIGAVTIARQVCSNCHGVTGNSISPNFPHLAGMPAPYLAAQLTGFKSHGRQDPAGFEYMWGLSRSLTDAQVQGLATYYAGQAPASNMPAGDPAKVAAGKALFAAGVPGKGVPACTTCHGAQAQGNDTFPRLAGQHADYVVKQLEVFQRSNDRPEGAVMKTIAHGLAEADIGNLAEYVQSLGAGAR